MSRRALADADKKERSYVTYGLNLHKEQDADLIAYLKECGPGNVSQEIRSILYEWSSLKGKSFGKMRKDKDSKEITGIHKMLDQILGLLKSGHMVMMTAEDKEGNKYNVDLPDGIRGMLQANIFNDEEGE